MPPDEVGVGTTATVLATTEMTGGAVTLMSTAVVTGARLRCL